MNSKHLRLAADLLDLASESYANHCCNDYELPAEWSSAERDDFLRAAAEWNGDPEEYDPGHRYTQDWFVMAYLAARLRAEAGGEP